MAKIVLQEQEEILTFPTDSILELKIEECNVITQRSQDGEREWQSVDFKFKILGIQALGDGSRDFEPYENWITRDIYGRIPFRLTDSPENKLRIWAEAIFRQELGVGFELDTDLFVDRHVRGITSRYESKNRDANGAPFWRAKIDTLLPMGNNGQQPSQSPAPQPQQQQASVPVDPWKAPAPATNDPWAGTPGWGGDEPPF